MNLAQSSCTAAMVRHWGFGVLGTIFESATGLAVFDAFSRGQLLVAPACADTLNMKGETRGNTI